jgi:hypothetical protein
VRHGPVIVYCMAMILQPGLHLGMMVFTCLGMCQPPGLGLTRVALRATRLEKTPYSLRKAAPADVGGFLNVQWLRDHLHRKGRTANSRDDSAGVECSSRKPAKARCQPSVFGGGCIISVRLRIDKAAAEGLDMPCGCLSLGLATTSGL